MKQHIILFAEDDLDWGKLRVGDLKKLGYDVVWARNGMEALALYKEHAPDLLLLDVLMPYMDGFQVAGEIRKKDQQTPIIFLTSMGGMENKRKGFNAGAEDYISKNVDEEELFLRIEAHIQRNPVDRYPILEITPDTRLNLMTQELTCCGALTRLPVRDYDLLRQLLLHKDVPQDREELTLRVYGDKENNVNSMNKGVSLLRKCLSADKRIRLIANRGGGITLHIDRSS